MHALFRLMLLSLLPLASWVHAELPRTVMWKDLVPEVKGESAFSALSKPQLQLLSDVAFARDRKAAGEKLSNEEQATERESARKLKAEGIDVEELLRKRREVMDQWAAQAKAVNSAVVGQLVRLPGYLLPLEFKGKDVSEFLLVPWVGACIHTPPPPANQIVHVTPDRPFPSSSLFLPVWVVGKLVATSTQKSLHLVDGTSEISVSYSLEASLVESYTEEAK